MPNPLENNLMLQYISGAGSAIGGPGSFADSLNKMTQQNIAAQSMHKTNQSYIKMLRDMLGKGGKINLDKDNISIKAPANMFGEGGGTGGPGGGVDHRMMTGLLEGSGPGGGVDPRAGISPMQPTAIPQQYADPGIEPVGEVRNVLNPSPSPLGVNAADLAGLTPENVSQAMSGAISASELERRTINDVSASALSSARTRRLDAGTRALTPSIKLPGTDIMVTEQSFVDMWKAATKDQRSSALKAYDRTKSEGYKGNLDTWMHSLAKASGKGLAEVLAQVAAVDTLKDKSKIEKVGYVAGIEKDLQKDADTWYRPPNYKSYKDQGLGPSEARTRGQRDMVLKRIDRDIRGRYPNSDVVGKPDGWYVDGKLIRKNPYGKD
jgi:hypothetical protein